MDPNSRAMRARARLMKRKRIERVHNEAVCRACGLSIVRTLPPRVDLAKLGSIIQWRT